MSSPIVTFASGVTKTSAATEAGVDISSAAFALAKGEKSLCIQVTELKAASGVPAASFAFEDSVDNFTGHITRKAWEFQGPIDAKTGSITQTVRCSEQCPNIALGIASAKGRANLQQLLGTNPSITYTMWIEG